MRDELHLAIKPTYKTQHVESTPSKNLQLQIIGDLWYSTDQ